MGIYFRPHITAVTLIGCMLLDKNVMHAAVTVCDFSRACPVGLCGLGEYFSGAAGACLPCSPHTYMDLSQHACSCCKPCTVASSSDGQIAVRACSAVSDAVIGCAPDYVKEASTSACIPCPECDIRKSQGSPCDNTECPQGPGPATEWQKGRPVRTSVVIVGSVAGSLIVVLIVAGLIKYTLWKSKLENFKYPSSVNI